MEFKDLITLRRSVRKYSAEPVSTELLDRVVKVGLTAPSARNSRSTHFIIVEDISKVTAMAECRDYGASFMRDARAAIVIVGDVKKSDLWRENASIAATLVQLACTDEGVGSCWVHLDGRLRIKEQPEMGYASDFVKELIAIPEGCEPLCIISIGYPERIPSPLPIEDDSLRVIRVK